MKFWLSAVWAALCGRVKLVEVQGMEALEGTDKREFITIDPEDTRFTLIAGRDLGGEPLVVLRIDQAQMIEVGGTLCQIVPFDTDDAREFALGVLECASAVDPLVNWGVGREEDDD